MKKGQRLSSVHKRIRATRKALDIKSQNIADSFKQGYSVKIIRDWNRLRIMKANLRRRTPIRRVIRSNG